MTTPAGCTIKPLDEDRSREWLTRVNAPSAPSAEHSDFTWLLAHCHDGVVWGWANSSGWHLSSSAYPRISPPLGERNVQQLRIFGMSREILIWRTSDGLAGREIVDDPPPSNGDDPCHPSTEERILVGDRLLEPSKAGFSLVGDARGSRHAVPLACGDATFRDKEDRSCSPLRLAVRHYFTIDDEAAPVSLNNAPRALATGLVRVAASRLVSVHLHGAKGQHA